jgi:hypothetical protein
MLTSSQRARLARVNSLNTHPVMKQALRVIVPHASVSIGGVAYTTIWNWRRGVMPAIDKLSAVLEELGWEIVIRHKKTKLDFDEWMAQYDRR